MQCCQCQHTLLLCCPLLFPVCIRRWKEAADVGKAPPVVLSGCHIRALDYVDLDLLKAHAVAEEQQQ
jgi:uncharacterized protein (DUF2237 family)